MSYYVYRYMHPDYPWLYVGKAANLKTRIYQHDRCKTDNISREYETLLHESVVYYLELANEVQGDYIEKLLIDKYKPFLNKKDKVDGESPIEFTLPKWKRFIRRCDVNANFNNSCGTLLKTLAKEQQDVDEKISEAKRALSDKRTALSAILRDITDTTSIYDNASIDSINSTVSCPVENMYRIDSDEIIMFYKKYESTPVQFLAYGYNSFGKRKLFTITKDGIMTPDAKAPTPLDSPLFPITFVIPVYFGMWFPNNVVGWSMLKEIYVSKIKAADDDLKDRKRTVDSFIEYVSKHHNIDDGRISYTGHDNNHNEYSLWYHTYIGIGVIDGKTCNVRYTNFEYCMNNKTVCEYEQSDRKLAEISLDDIVKTITNLPDNIVWYSDTDGKIMRRNTRDKLAKKVLQIEATIQAVKAKTITSQMQMQVEKYD